MARFMVMAAMVVPVLLVACGGGEAIEGVVGDKAIGGVIDDTSYTIIRSYLADGQLSIVVTDHDFDDYFLEAKDDTISDALDVQLGLKYSDVRYLVNIRDQP